MASTGGIPKYSGECPLYVVTRWTWVQALMGVVSHPAVRTGPFTTHLRAASYPVYIIHKAVLVAVAYYVLMLAIHPPLQFMAS